MRARIGLINLSVAAALSVLVADAHADRKAGTNHGGGIPSISLDGVAPVPAETLHQWPEAETFLESLLVASDGAVLLTNHSTGRVHRWQLDTGVHDFAWSHEAALRSLTASADTDLSPSPASTSSGVYRSAEPCRTVARTACRCAATVSSPPRLARPPHRSPATGAEVSAKFSRKP